VTASVLLLLQYVRVQTTTLVSNRTRC